MKIQLASRCDLEGLAKLDGDAGHWGYDEFIKHVQNFGTVKLLSEGQWVLGWMAYRAVSGLVMVERFVTQPDPQTEGAVALRMAGHLERLATKYRAIDLSLPDGRMSLAKILAGAGYIAAVVKDFYGEGHDAITLHKKLHSDERDDTGGTVTQQPA